MLRDGKITATAASVRIAISCPTTSMTRMVGLRNVESTVRLQAQHRAPTHPFAALVTEQGHSTEAHVGTIARVRLGPWELNVAGDVRAYLACANRYFSLDGISGHFMPTSTRMPLSDGVLASTIGSLNDRALPPYRVRERSLTDSQEVSLDDLVWRVRNSCPESMSGMLRLRT